MRWNAELIAVLVLGRANQFFFFDITVCRREDTYYAVGFGEMYLHASSIQQTYLVLLLFTIVLIHMGRQNGYRSHFSVCLIFFFHSSSQAASSPFLTTSSSWLSWAHPDATLRSPSRCSTSTGTGTSTQKNSRWGRVARKKNLGYPYFYLHFFVVWFGQNARTGKEPLHLLKLFLDLLSFRLSYNKTNYFGSLGNHIYVPPVIPAEPTGDPYFYLHFFAVRFGQNARKGIGKKPNFTSGNPVLSD